MKWQAVLPYTYLPYYEACVATMADEFKEHTLFIDNTDPDKNIGIMKSHNRGVSYMKEQGADWLVIISAAIRFGPEGGLDFVKVLADHPSYYVVHAATANVKGGLQQKPEGRDQANGVFGWHLTAFHRSVFENVGVWDENFTPYGWDDVDLSIRIQAHYKGAPGWDTFPVDVHDTTMGHSVKLAGVKSPTESKMEYFKRKWGRDTVAWQEKSYDYPFNDDTKPLSYWPEPPDPRINREAWGLA